MAGDPLSRRRFLIVGGVALGGALAAGASWLSRSEPTADVGSASSTTPTATTAAPTTATTRPTTTTPNAPSPGIPVICKEAWGAQPPAGSFVSHSIDRITVHHTAVALESNKQAPARARQHQTYHQGLGWSDLAYHFLVDGNGHVYEGRPVSAVGDTATNYDPTGHLLICCEGNFDEQDLPAAQYESLLLMLAWGAAEFGIDPVEIAGHRELASTTCPGDNLHRLLAEGTLQADVGALAAHAPRLESVCGSVAAELVAAIEAGTA